MTRCRRAERWISTQNKRTTEKPARRARPSASSSASSASRVSPASRGWRSRAAVSPGLAGRLRVLENNTVKMVKAVGASDRRLSDLTMRVESLSDKVNKEKR